MAQWNKDEQAYDNQSTRHEVYMRADQYGNIINHTSAATSAFGEPITVPITPVIQLDGLYGLDSRNFQTYSANNGSANTTNTLMQCQTGTDQFGYGVIRSYRAVRYRPGQGALARFTTMFSPGVAGYTQRAGFFAQEQALQFGYDGTSFGVLRQNGGKAHIEQLIVTAAATSASNVTITLNDIAYVIPITINAIGINAAEISEWFQANASDAWLVEHCDGIVNFLSTSVGVNAGTFSFSAGTTGATATLSTIQTGVAHTTNWTPQTAWNVDTYLGDGPVNGNPSGVLLNTTKLNVYQIGFRWLGAGQITYSIENPETGDIMPVHEEHYVNEFDDVHIDNPSLKIGYVAASLGGTGNNVIVSGASLMGAIEGKIGTTKFPTSASSISANTWAADTLHHGITVHNRLLFNNKINTRELLVKSISASFRTAPVSQPVEIFMFFNHDNIPSPAVYNIINSTESSAFYSDVIGTMTIGNNIPIFTTFTNGGSAVTIDLEKLRIVVPPNGKITLAFRSPDLISRASTAINFIED